MDLENRINRVKELENQANKDKYDELKKNKDEMLKWAKYAKQVLFLES